MCSWKSWGRLSNDIFWLGVNSFKGQWRNVEVLFWMWAWNLDTVLTVAFDLLEIYAFLLTYCTTFQLSLYIKSSISCMRVFQSSIAVSTNVKMFVSLLLLNVYKLYFNGHWAVLHPARRPLVGVHMRTLLTWSLRYAADVNPSSRLH